MQSVILRPLFPPPITLSLTHTHTHTVQTGIAKVAILIGFVCVCVRECPVSVCGPVHECCGSQSKPRGRCCVNIIFQAAE